MWAPTPTSRASSRAWPAPAPPRPAPTPPTSTTTATLEPTRTSRPSSACWAEGPAESHHNFHAPQRRPARAAQQRQPPAPQPLIQFVHRRGVVRLDREHAARRQAARPAQPRQFARHQVPPPLVQPAQRPRAPRRLPAHPLDLLADGEVAPLRAAVLPQAREFILERVLHAPIVPPRPDARAHALLHS